MKGKSSELKGSTARLRSECAITIVYGSNSRKKSVVVELEISERM